MTRSPRKRYRRDPLSPASEPIPQANEIWHILAPLDEVARRMEAKWGIERLPCLVSEQTAHRFGVARSHLDDLLEANNSDPVVLTEIEAAAANLRKGWIALDREAEAAGHVGFDPAAWTFTIAGRPAAVVRDPAAQASVQAKDPERTVFTLDGIGNLLGTLPYPVGQFVENAQKAFPGSEVSVHSKMRDDLEDDIPF